MARPKKAAGEKYPTMGMSLRPDQARRLTALAYLLRAPKSEIVQEGLDLLLEAYPLSDEQVKEIEDQIGAGNRPPLVPIAFDADEAAERVKLRLRRWRESNALRLRDKSTSAEPDPQSRGSITRRPKRPAPTRSTPVRPLPPPPARPAPQLPPSPLAEPVGPTRKAA